MKKRGGFSLLFLFTIGIFLVNNSCLAQVQLIAGSKSNLMITEFSPPKKLCDRFNPSPFVDSIDIDYNGKYDILLNYKYTEIKPQGTGGGGYFNYFTISPINNDFQTAFVWDTTSVPGGGNCNSSYPNGKSEFPLVRVFYLNDTIKRSNEIWNDTSSYLFHFYGRYLATCSYNNFSKIDSNYFIAVKKQVDSSTVLLGYINITGGKNSFYLNSFAIQGKDSSILISSVNEFKENGKVIVFPNPANNKVTVYCDEVSEEPISILLFSSYGDLLYSGKAKNYYNDINLDKFPNGLYWLKAGATTKPIFKN